MIQLELLGHLVGQSLDEHKGGFRFAPDACFAHQLDRLVKLFSDRARPSIEPGLQLLGLNLGRYLQVRNGDA